MLNLDAYFQRIGLHAPVTPTLAGLNQILSAHIQAIPFENLDVLLSRGISLELEQVFDKLVVQGRGGYCFEQNTLLLAVLQQLGFAARPLSARVRYQQPRTYMPARTHLFLRVELADGPWLADVGVGGVSPTAALRLDHEGEQATPHEPRRIVREEGRYFHQVRFADGWHDVYEFTGEEMPAIDREVANWFTSAHPRSHFRSRLLVARAAPDGARLTLLNREFTERERSGEARHQTVSSPEALLAILRERFGLSFPAETRFVCPGLDWS